MASRQAALLALWVISSVLWIGCAADTTRNGIEQALQRSARREIDLTLLDLLNRFNITVSNKTDEHLTPLQRYCKRCSSEASCDFAGFVNGKVEFECKCKPGFTGNGTHCEGNVFDCDFDTGFCGWTQDTDHFEWIRHSGSTGTSGTGPSNDKSGNGAYIYIEASGRSTGEMARILSPVVSASGGLHCITFYYHMYGADIDTLKVHRKYISDSSLGKPIFTKYGNQGDKWIKAEVVFPALKDYQIAFAASRGSGIYGDIGLDDISLKTVGCHDSQTTRSSTVPTTVQGMSIGNKISVQLQSTTLTATTQPTTKSTAQSETSPTFTRQWTTESATQPATVQVTTRPATVTLTTTTQSAIQLTTTAKLTKPPKSKSTFNPTTTKSTITKSTTGSITSPKAEVKSRCKNRTTVVRLGKGEQYAKVMLELPNHQIKMTLPPGEHNYEISSREQEERCYHKFMIYAWTGVIRSIQLQAEYQFDCTSLTSIAYSIIDASLLQHTKNLQRLCPSCHASQNQTLPVVKCLSNRLVVTWSTDLDQQQPFGDNPMKGLRRALLNYQESFPTSTILQLTILSTLPRVVSPMKDKSGLYITPVITASCLKNGQIYDSVNKICLQRLNHRPQVHRAN